MLRQFLNAKSEQHTKGVGQSVALNTGHKGENGIKCPAEKEWCVRTVVCMRELSAPVVCSMCLLCEIDVFSSQFCACKVY